MAIKSGFKKINLSDESLSRFQDNVDRAFNALSTQPALNGNFLTVTLAVGDNKIEHKLGRRIRFYQVGPRSAALNYYDKISTDVSLDSSFTLVSDVACTVTIWVF